MIVRLAIKGSNSDAISGSREGHVVAAYPVGKDFGEYGERVFVGLTVDLPETHPLVLSLGSPIPAADGYKYRYRVDLALLGFSAKELARIRDRGVRSPDTKPIWIGAIIDRDVAVLGVL